MGRQTMIAAVTGTAQRLIKEQEVLPRLTLPRADSEGSMGLSGQQSSLLVFLHSGRCDGCVSYLAELAAVVEDLRGWNTRLLAVVGASGEAADESPFPVLVDADSSARGRLGIGADEAAVILADQWGEVVEVETFGSDHGFPLPSHLVESAKIVDLSCGECNVPGPEWGEDD